MKTKKDKNDESLDFSIVLIASFIAMGFMGFMEWFPFTGILKLIDAGLLAGLIAMAIIIHERIKPQNN